MYYNWSPFILLCEAMHCSFNNIYIEMICTSQPVPSFSSTNIEQFAINDISASVELFPGRVSMLSVHHHCLNKPTTVEPGFTTNLVLSRQPEPHLPFAEVLHELKPCAPHKVLSTLNISPFTTSVFIASLYRRCH